MTRSELIRFLILRTIGNFLVLFAIFGIFSTFGQALYYETTLKIAEARGIKYVVQAKSLTPTPTPDKNNPIPSVTNAPTPTRGFSNEPSGVDNFAQVLAGPKEQILVPKDTEFSLIIPKIGASAKIFPNVDPGSEEVFLPILKQGIAHAKGTVFPGLSGNTYLFAHSTDNFWDVGRYNAVFYLLKELQKGDEIVVFFQNKRYDYVVRETKIVDPTDVSYIVNSQKEEKQVLILQTCWPPGTTWQRLLVFADPK